MKITVVVGDIGAAKELVPVVEVLRKKGHQVAWIVDRLEKARAILNDVCVPVTDCVPEHADKFDIIAVGTSATAVQAQIEWTRAGHNKGVMVAWYEDLWGTGERSVTREVDPDCMLVINQAAAEIARQVRPGLDCRVVGKPTFKILTTYTIERVAEIRNHARSGLGMADNNVLIVYWSGGDYERAKVHLDWFVKLLAGLKLSSGALKIALKIHPKMIRGDELGEEARELIPNLNLADNAHKVGPVELNCAADLVLSEFDNTQTYTAAAVGALPMIAMVPDNLEERRQCGFPKGTPPFIKHGLGIGVESSDEIAYHIRRVVAGLNIKRRAQAAREFLGQAMGSGADERIAQAILELIR